MRATWISLGIILFAACSKKPDNQPLTPPPGNPPPSDNAVVRAQVIDIIPRRLSGETWQDAEPFLSLYASNPNFLAASAFTPNPGGAASGTAPIFASSDGGNTWSLRNKVPSQLMTADITHAVGRSPRELFAGFMRQPDYALGEDSTGDFLSLVMMKQLAMRSNIDQPFVRTITSGNAQRLYVGLNDFNAPGGRTATVDLSLNGGATFASRRIETRNTVGQNAPSIRPAPAEDGTVYVAYLGWRSATGSTIKSDVVVARDDHGGSGANPFKDLVDPSDHLPGRLVATNVTIQWSNAPTMGQERIGSTLSLAVDPHHAENVYVAWGDRVGNGDIWTVHVRRSNDRGATWTNDVRTLKNATAPSLAVSTNGTVGLLYHQLTGSANTSRWVTHLEQSRDGFATRHDIILATVPAMTPAYQFLPYLGDYNFLLTRGNKFLGIFSANNTPDSANFPHGVVYQRRVDFATHRLLDRNGAPVAVSIDPFFFSANVLP